MKIEADTSRPFGKSNGKRLIVIRANPAQEAMRLLDTAESLDWQFLKWDGDWLLFVVIQNELPWWLEYFKQVRDNE